MMLAALLHALTGRRRAAPIDRLTTLRPRVVERDGLAYVVFTRPRAEKVHP